MSYTASYTLSCNGLQTSRKKVEWRNLGLLVDPVEGGALPGDELLRLEPEGNLLLGVLDAVGTVADVAADVLMQCQRQTMTVRSQLSLR